MNYRHKLQKRTIFIKLRYIIALLHGYFKFQKDKSNKEILCEKKTFSLIKWHIVFTKIYTQIKTYFMTMALLNTILIE